MKRKALLTLALAITGMIVLAGCTSSEQGSVQPSGGQNTNPGAQSRTGTQTSGGQITSDQTSNTTGDQDVFSGEDAGGIQGTGQSEGSAQDTAGANGSVADEREPLGDVISDEDAASAENDPVDPAQEESTEVNDGWSGTYVGENETVTLKKLDDTQISFSFAEATISGIANIKETQAVYYGDDHHVVIFTINHDLLDVDVTSEEDYDTSDSPIIGHYVKEK